MKKRLLTILGAVCISALSLAQIPNFSFESWSAVGAYEVPNQWGTLNNTTKTFSVYTVTKATPGNPGNFYMKITSKTMGTSVAPGIAVSGVLDSITMKPKSGFPYAMQPAAFAGRWQHMIYGTTQGSLRALLTKWNTSLNKRDTIALAAQVLSGMAMSWANFSINFVYYSSVVPDSCSIDLRASGVTPTNLDYLWVDNLAFTGSVTGLNNSVSILNYVLMYPNPTTEEIKLSLNLEKPQTVKVDVVDLTGKTIYSKNYGVLSGESLQTINVSDIAKGIYFVKVIADESIQTRKIVIE